MFPEDAAAFKMLNWWVYCRYCELRETGLLKSLGFSQMYFHDKYRISFPRNVCFEYFSQFSPRDFADVRVEVKKVDTTALTLVHTFYKRREKLKAQILVYKVEAVIVAYGEKTHKKTPLPTELAKALLEGSHTR